MFKAIKEWFKKFKKKEKKKALAPPPPKFPPCTVDVLLHEIGTDVATSSITILASHLASFLVY